MTSINDLYSEANAAKQKGDIGKATQLYKSLIKKFPDTLEAEYADINIKEMESHRDIYSAQDKPLKALNVFKFTTVYGFVGAIIGFIIPFFFMSSADSFGIIFLFTTPFGFIIGSLFGLCKGIDP